VLGALAWLAARWLRRERPGVVGRVLPAHTPLAPRGQVLLDGVPVAAESAEPVQPGEQVRVLGVEQGVLRVAPVGVAGPLAGARRGRLRPR
jgi:membrane-bound ClpP family serine protease